MRKKLSAILIIFVFAVTYASDHVYFPEIRAKAAKVTKLSQEDFALGKELMIEIRKLAATRRKALPDTILVAESLSAAGRMWFTDHNYSDRQLFAARDMWEPSNSQFKKAGHAKTFELMKLSGFDAFTTFMYKERGIKYLENMEHIKPDFKYVLGLCPRNYEGRLEANALKSVSASRYTFRLNGKILLLNYTWLDFEKTGEFISQVEKYLGEPFLYIHSQGTIEKLEDPFVFWFAGKGVPATTILYWFDHLSKMLEICAGIAPGGNLQNPDGTWNYRYHDEILMPLFNAVLAQEKYNGKKFFALDILPGYNNYRGKQRTSHDGTKTVRGFMELALKYKADIIKAFEWDEYNEDTHFQPTVNKPMALMRIMSYYSARLDGRKLAALPGDDHTKPNLIISHRKQIPGGVDYELEVLNVPDSDKSEKFQVNVEILNEKKQVLLSRKLEFDSGKIQDYTLRIASKDYISSRVLITRLTINHQGKQRVIQEGLPFTMVRPTTINDSTWYSTPLRNVLFPKHASVTFGKAVNPAGALQERIEIPAGFKASFPEKLNSLEVVQDGRDTRYTFDPQNEFRQNDPDRVNLILSFYRLEIFPNCRFDFRMEMKNAPSALWYEMAKDPKNRYLPNVSVKSFEFSFADRNKLAGLSVNSWRNARVISLKKSEFDQAVFSIEATYVSGVNKGKKVFWELPLVKLKAAGVYNRIFADGLQLAIEIPQRMDMLPLPLNTPDVQFKTTLHTGYPTGIFAVRAVSREGKVWWSAPHVLSQPESGKSMELALFHNSAGAIKINIDSSRVPHIQYRFDPSIAGNILTTAAGREFYGNIGGYDLVPTGYEGYHCSVYSIPGAFRRKAQIGDDRLFVPKYEKLSDGSWCLNFTGKGEFIGFPPSLFAQRTGYTVKFEFMPLDIGRDQVYFTHSEHSPAGFRLRTEDGRLVADFYCRQTGDGKRDTYQVFKTNLNPVESKWNKIVFKYDMDKVYITLNGKTESFPCKGIARWFAVGGFGGDGSKSVNGDIHYFKGKLKSFEVIHSTR
ncbi:MAG: hypothetical protein IJW33_07100 [Lentisphaeria bacterium]|nr:hypothetical protein [Lentisphaeria bacterium]